MKKGILLVLAFGLLAACSTLWLSYQSDTTTASATETTIDDSDYYSSRGIAKALKYLDRVRRNQETGKVDVKQIIAARKQAEMKASTKAGVDLDWEFMGPNNIGGRVRAVLFDRENPDKMFTGGVSGGLFTSLNGGLEWKDHPQNQTFESLTVSSIVQTVNGDIYMGTGEYIEDGFSYGDAGAKYPGSGVYKSTDGGDSFNLLASTSPDVFGSDPANTAWATVIEMAVHPTNASVVFAATNAGLYRTDNGGESWTVVEGISTSLTAYDVDIASDGTVHALAGSSYYRSSDGGVTFANMAGPEPEKFSATGGNKKLAIAPSNDNYIYIATIKTTSTANGQLKQVLQSKDGGNSWIEIGAGGSTFFGPLCSDNGDGTSRCQGWYDLLLGVDPANEGRVFLGGITLWNWTEELNWQQLDFIADFPGNVYYIHADKHEIAFHPTNPEIMFIGTDGGLAYTSNASDNQPIFETRNKNLNITQFYAVGAGLEGRIIGGSQDNGTQYISYDSNAPQTSREVFGNDGGYAFASKINPQALFASWQNGNLLRSSNGGGSFGAYVDQRIDCQPTNTDGSCGGDQVMDGEPEFITPYLLWEDFDSYFATQNTANPIRSARILTGSGDGFSGTGEARVWLTVNPLDFGTVPTWYNIGRFQGGTSNVSAVAMSRDGSTAYVGTDNGKLMRIGNLNSVETLESIHADFYDSNGFTNPNVTEIDVPFTGRNVTSLSVGLSPDELLVSLGNFGNEDYIYRSSNATSSDPVFVSAQGDLPQAPVYSVIFDEGNPNLVIAGTEHGVWTGDVVQVGVTEFEYSWSASNAGIGNVPVHSLRQEPMKIPGCNVLYAGTFGRGFWRSTTLTFFTCDTDVPEWSAVGIDDPSTGQLPLALSVYPNPMDSETTIKVDVKDSGIAKITVYDLQGRQVRNMDLGNLPTGTHTFNLSRENLSQGQYIVALEINDSRAVKQLMVK